MIPERGSNSMGNPLQEELLAHVRAIRDEKRPTMELVVDVIDRLFDKFAEEVEYKRVSRGPVTWSWVDVTNSAAGYEKWYVLTGSTMDGTEGYPLLTVRQSMAPRLDSWLSVSQLIVGPDERDIETSLAMAIANHNGAFEGLRQSVSNIVDLMSGNGTAVPGTAPKGEMN